METLGAAGRPARDRIGALIEGLGPAIRRVRRERGLTQEELAGEVGASVAHLSRLESGARQPSLDGLLRVAAALGVEVGELLDASEEPGPGTVVRGATSPVYEQAGFSFQSLTPEAGPEGLAAMKIIFPADRGETEYKEHEGEEWIYVLSGKLVRSSFAGWEVISWVLVVALPATIPLSLWSMPQDPASVPAWSWTGFLYVALMSQYLGFFAWNAGLAIGGIAHVSQVQLLQTFVTLVIASFLNRETIHASAWAVAGAVLLLVLAANRASVSQAKA